MNNPKNAALSVLAALLIPICANGVFAQQDIFESEVIEETIATEVAFGSHEESAHPFVEDHHAHSASMDMAAAHEALRSAAGQASASLKDITWELFSRLAAQILSGNQASLLSGNEPEVLSGNKTKVASENQLNLFSGNQVNLFSNIQIDIQLSGMPNPAQAMMGMQRDVRVEVRPTPSVDAQAMPRIERLDARPPVIDDDARPPVIDDGAEDHSGDSSTDSLPE